MKITEITFEQGEGVMTSEKVAKKFRCLTKADQEYMVIQYLSLQNWDMGAEIITAGQTTTLTFDLLPMVRKIVMSGATGIYVVHNHPGDSKAKPSKQDLTTAQDILLAMNKIGVKVWDQIIVARESWWSEKENKETEYNDNPENE